MFLTLATELTVLWFGFTESHLAQKNDGENKPLGRKGLKVH